VSDASVYGELAQDVSTWSAAVSAAAAILAAFFSWRSRVTARDQQLPFLHAQLADVRGRRTIAIENAGPGIAKGVGFLVIDLGERCAGVVPPPAGFLRPGEGVTTEMHFTIPRAARPRAPQQNYGVFYCRDLHERPHYWTLQGDHRVFTTFSWKRLRRVPRYPGVEAAMKILYKNAPAVSQLDRLREVGISHQPELDVSGPLFTSGDPPADTP
jgi:hypothetical protein